MVKAIRFINSYTTKLSSYRFFLYLFLDAFTKLELKTDWVIFAIPHQKSFHSHKHFFDYLKEIVISLFKGISGIYLSSFLSQDRKLENYRTSKKRKNGALPHLLYLW